MIADAIEEAYPRVVVEGVEEENAVFEVQTEAGERIFQESGQVELSADTVVSALVDFGMKRPN
uniref:Uncharacterized protein n=1 Tax=Tetraselmis sp. GSL018 TaxID=582737 RepID=A0A061RD88_9CHLO